ncbi:S41 family peptidase [Patescibacteria group bacterium]
MNFKHKAFHCGFCITIAITSFVIGWYFSTIDYKTDPITKDVTIIKNIAEVSDDEHEIDLSLYWLVWDLLSEKYVDEENIDTSAMIYGSIKGLVSSLDDPYTVFMNPEESEEFNDSLEGTLEGIGAELTIEERNLVIVSPLRNSPAEKAGIEPGDIIYMIDGEFAAEMTLFDAIMSIRGEMGTTVVLTILRDGLGEPFEVPIVRDSIDIDSVTVEKLDDEITYLSINQFNDKTLEEFSSAISEMILEEARGLIIDLRFNGGGYLDIAVELLSFILPEDTTAVKIEQRGMENEVMYTNGQVKLLDIPVVVLVNEGSASASEIVAGAIQDYERGVIMGTQTFGKGSVQEVESFSDGSSIRLTIAKWFTPNGTNIDEVGLTPDIIVEIEEADIEAEIDTQKEAAIEYIKNIIYSSSV